MTKLEMVYFMNVILYIENSIILSIPLISTKCKDACNAMKINPWNNCGNLSTEIKRIKTTFPNIQTFRIDDISYDIFGDKPLFQKFQKIDIVHSLLGDPFYYEPNILKDKCLIAFSLKEVGKYTRTVYLTKYSFNTFDLIQRYKNIKFLFLKRDTPPTTIEIQKINACSKTIKIAILLKNTDVNSFIENNDLTQNVILLTISVGCLCIVPTYTNIDFSISPLNSIKTLTLFENQYLPTKLLIETNNILSNYLDLTPLKYVKEITFSTITPQPQNYFKLPKSIKNINFDYINDYIHINIMNWNELNNITEIDDHFQLDIPYPQITKRKLENQRTRRTKRNLTDLYLGLLNMICAFYIILSLIYNIKIIIYSKFDIKIIQQASFNHYFWYIHLAVFTIVNFYYFELGNNVVFMIFLMCCCCFMWYPYSLLYYKSNIWLHFLSFLSIPMLSQHILLIFDYFQIFPNYFNHYLIILLHGYWIKQKQLNEFKKLCITLLDLSRPPFFLFIFFTIPIGLIISFFSLNGLFTYFNVLGLFGFIGAFIVCFLDALQVN